ncbi:uncharacterized protein FFUJ_05552 [Fusarium fujikuroi IMI 58289]|uniref:Uncharacterized protein n=1 Tax=Gibberella fujikuroi (strain CBS 195.34 / IMI 58289 / NRRL A-6831) TaxID=1279085 RepID=S0E4R6_GIBF5|nr:uncharacterized protein FFUJ_05552 [Fusarium fujikuroi IMI 58289]CCT69650.1 uncharacterized protein FFUJ_05552 [Fusarium fujikuroi IMI 58289]SCN82865.1 uncharacterized protein FFC1_04044 [Fusarium fujikuroi]SCO26687.1 uncharacterized protein FFM5_14956 [Fusarium fujikuroi]SCV59568.1 uncharacterized protein FFFS_14137 [Fusarium fujikuroi]
MGNVEGNLMKLEDRLFGRLDGNEHQSRSRLRDGQNSQLIGFWSEVLKTHSLIELTQMVQAQRGLWAKVDAAKLEEARLKGQPNFMIIALSEWVTGDDIRKQPTNLENLFQHEHGCSRGLSKIELREPGVKRKASHQRLILQTELLNTAKRLTLTGVTYSVIIMRPNKQISP